MSSPATSVKPGVLPMQNSGNAAPLRRVAGDAGTH
jgi:hypothetical protein